MSPVSFTLLLPWCKLTVIVSKVFGDFVKITLNLVIDYESSHWVKKRDSSRVIAKSFLHVTRVESNHQRWPESLFQTPTPLLFQNFWIQVRLFKFENPTPVQTPATIIHPIVIYPRLSLRNDGTDSCYCRNGKVTTDPGPVFHKFLTPDPGLKEKPRILPESTPVIRIRSHLCLSPIIVTRVNAIIGRKAGIVQHFFGCAEFNKLPNKVILLRFSEVVMW